jgi:5'-3' exonuclease
MNISIIDGDSICYICSKENIKDSIESVDSLLDTILSLTSAEGYYLFISEGKYFRHRINTDYKGNRKKSSLLYTRTLKQYLKEEYKAKAYSGVEADDLVAFFAHNYKKEALKTVCSIDKDVLYQLEGNYFNYMTHQSGITSEEDANYFLWKQVLMGDSSDGVEGIPGIGKIKAEKILEETNKENYANTVLNKYIQVYGKSGIYHFQKNYRQVCLLKTREDFINEIGSYPEIEEPIFLENNSDKDEECNNRREMHSDF